MRGSHTTRALIPLLSIALFVNQLLQRKILKSSQLDEYYALPAI